VGIRIAEADIPVQEPVRAACELLGLDPLYVANEGKLVAVVPAADAETVLAKIRLNRYGARSAIIGEVVAAHPGRVVMTTPLGASRIIDMLVGELLPRIC
jgi:hydrogenase expression/formation protein HypE